MPRPKRKVLGQGGGRAIFAQRGSEYMREIGSRGGRKATHPTWRDQLEAARAHDEELRQRREAAKHQRKEMGLAGLLVDPLAEDPSDADEQAA